MVAECPLIIALFVAVLLLFGPLLSAVIPPGIASFQCLGDWR